MSTADLHHDAHDGHGGQMRSYVTGFVLAVVLTAIPFALVMGHYAEPGVLLPVIMAIGAVQVVVHLKYFLHLTGTPDGIWNMTALLLTIVIVAIVVAGSVWVIYELNSNMMPWMSASHHAM